MPARSRPKSGPTALRRGVILTALFFSLVATLSVPSLNAIQQSGANSSAAAGTGTGTGTQQARTPATWQNITPAVEQKLPAPPRKQDVKKAKEAYRQGLKLEQNRDWQAAYDAYSDAVDWDPNNREYLMRQAVAKGQVVQMKVDLAEREAVSGHFSSALHALRDAMQLDPSDRTIRERLTEMEALDPARARQIIAEPVMMPAVQLDHRPGKQSFHLHGQTESAYQEIAQRFGVEVAFDVDVRQVPVQLDLQEMDFATATRVLGQATNTFWRPLTKHLFFVAPDTTQKRKDYEVSIVRTVLLASSETNEQMTELSRLVREIAGIVRTDLDTKSRTLTMRASPQAIAVATGIIDDLQHPPDELILELEVMEVDRSNNLDAGITGPQTATIYSIPSNAAQLVQQGGATALNALLTQVFGSASAIPPVLAFGGGKTSFFYTLPGATATLSNFLSTVHAGRRVLLRAEDGQPATFFVGERFPVSLAQFSSSLVGNATTTATQTPTASASTSTLPIITVTTGTNPDFVVTADFNDDNFQDFAVANFTDGTLTLFDGNPTTPGSFLTGTTIPVGAGPTWISTGFFNTKTDTSNTIVDLAVANQTAGTVSILHGNGDGTFTVEPSLTLPSGAGPTAIAVGDFNDDGFADLAVVNKNANTVSIFLGNGDETFQTPTTLVTGNAPTSIVAQAFNPNAPGIIDLAVTNSTDNTLQIFLGNGKGTFTNGVTYNTGVTPVFVASADMNLDGNLDLVVADSGAATTTNTVGNSVSVFLGNGDGTFILPGGTRMDFAAGTTPTSFVIADFNDDGIPDLIVTASGDDAVALMLGASGGFLNAPIEVPVGTTPDSIATADFNGDGLPDVAVSNFGSNTASVILDSSSLIGLLSSNGVGTQFPNAEYIDIGLKVKATPRVHENGDVSLQFEFTLSSLAGNSLNNIPVVNNQEIHQSVRVHADESALLAGYLAPQTISTLNGTPGIANLPLNGIVGGTTSSQFTNTEILILVTPRIVDSATRNKEHLIYAGRGQLGGPGSQGPTIQERRGGGFVNPVAQPQEPVAAPPQPQPEPTPRPQPEPQPQAAPPVQAPPDQPQTVPPQ
jgi:Bacterial type II and III secretion system protein/FG-GAP-like repeat/FG-GAP repeat